MMLRPAPLLILSGLLAGLLAGCGGADDADPAPDADTPITDMGGTDASPDAAPMCPAEGCPDGHYCQAGQCVEGCQDHPDCAEGQICFEGRCVGCRGDEDCALTTVCEMDACVPGCRDDDGCETGSICEGGACVAGCRDDEGCAEGQICEGGACIEGCREDDACPPGRYCAEDLTCPLGCRDDDECEPGRLCLDHDCIFTGVGCRDDDDCNEGDACDLESQRCVPQAPECVADAHEPDDEVATPVGAGIYADLTICPGDTDRLAIQLSEGQRLVVDASFVQVEGDLRMTLTGGPDDGPLAGAQSVEPGLARLMYVAEADRVVTLSVTGDTPDARLTYVLVIDIEQPQMCMPAEVYVDIDEDGYGDAAAAREACLLPDEPPMAGLALQAGDCAPQDPLRHPGAGGVCGDHVDDDCDGDDERCPMSAPAGLMVPDWDCAPGSNPPEHVVAWARFAEGGGFFAPGGCFVFFEGLPGEFYVQRRVTRAHPSPDCEQRNGCTCPSLNGWPSYDRRMYAFTRQDVPPAACAEISIRDHGGEEQPVSSDCRKYLYQMHFYDIPFSYVAGSIQDLRRRLTLYSRVEIACVEDFPHRNLPFQSLVETDIEFNDGYRPRP